MGRGEGGGRGYAPCGPAAQEGRSHGGGRWPAARKAQARDSAWESTCWRICPVTQSRRPKTCMKRFSMAGYRRVAEVAGGGGGGLGFGHGGGSAAGWGGEMGNEIFESGRGGRGKSDEPASRKRAVHQCLVGFFLEREKAGIIFTHYNHIMSLHISSFNTSSRGSYQHNCLPVSD